MKIFQNLNNKEKYSLYYRDDFDYCGIRDIENVFDEIIKRLLKTNISKKFF